MIIIEVLYESQKCAVAVIDAGLAFPLEVTSPPVILQVAASGYLHHLPFDKIVPLGLHEYGCNLEFQLHPHCLVLELLVGYGPGAEKLSQ